jgi:DNA-binding PucR family transcriptional regulator
MAYGDVWHSPSARCAELISSGARLMLDAPEIFDEVDQAVLAAAGDSITSDPTLSASMRATDRANLIHWLTSNIRAPGERVPANVGPDTLAIARDLVRRGLDDRATEAYRAGQNFGWRRWMELAFSLTSDLDELHELLDVTSQSIFAFIDDTLAGIREEIDRERETLTSGTQAERLEVVSLLLAGAPITAERASSRLQYELQRWHVAAILWSTVHSPDQGTIARAADAIARAAGAGRAFTVAPSSAALWTWFAAAEAPNAEMLAAVLGDIPAVHVAIGSAGFGVAGFRRSHMDALATQRLMHRSREDVRFARHDELRAVILASADEDSAREFTARVIGELAIAEDALRETLRTYLQEESNATRTASALGTHRNTVLNRLRRAQELLPEPLSGRTVEVGLALELTRWLGAPSPSGAPAKPVAQRHALTDSINVQRVFHGTGRG